MSAWEIRACLLIKVEAETYEEAREVLEMPENWEDWTLLGVQSAKKIEPTDTTSLDG